VSQAEQTIAEWKEKGIELQKQTGIPPLPLPSNIPPQQSPSNSLIHCTVGVAGQNPISIFLKRSDCLNWIKSAKDYDEKNWQALKLYADRHQEDVNRAAEEDRQQHAGAGREVVYALFLCFSQGNFCQIQGVSGETNMGRAPDRLFQSLDACNEYARRITGLVTPSEDGRFRIPNGMWYECRGKNVGTWQPLR
jgi:hypothetical protein